MYIYTHIYTHIHTKIPTHKKKIPLPLKRGGEAKKIKTAWTKMIKNNAWVLVVGTASAALMFAPAPSSTWASASCPPRAA